MNRDFKFIPEKDLNKININEVFDTGLKQIPLLDKKGRVIKMLKKGDRISSIIFMDNINYKPYLEIIETYIKPKYIPKPITRWGIKIKKQNKVIKDKKHENT